MNQQQSLDFIRQASLAVPDALDRNKVVACAVAATLVKQQDIPSAPVQDIAGHYINVISPRLRQQMSAFNEGVVFDIRFALEVARALWSVRYMACHGSPISMFKPENSFIENFTGASQAIAPDVVVMLNKHQIAIGLLGTTVASIFGSMLTDGQV